MKTLALDSSWNDIDFKLKDDFPIGGLCRVTVPFIRSSY